MRVFIFSGAIYHRCHQIRTFVNARVKWVRDSYLDRAVEVEKNFKQAHSLKTLIISQPSQTLPIFKISPVETQLDLPRPALNFCEKYPLIFKIFRPPRKISFPHVQLTPKAIALHIDEESIVNLPSYRKDLVERLAKFLMIARSMRVPLHVIDKFKFELGLPNDYLLTLLPEYPDFFRIVDMGIIGEDGGHVFGLELISWRKDLAVSVMEKRALSKGNKGKYIRFSMNFPRGYDLNKKLKNWVDEWQNLPYISPYENAFSLAPDSDQAEKWTVAVIHELLCLFLAKKAEKKHLFCLGEYLGFGPRQIKRATVHHPGIFYVSNKIRTQTVMLREEYTKNQLIEQHPLMLIRYKFIWLMKTVVRFGRPRRNRVNVHELDSPVKTAKRNELDSAKCIYNDDCGS